MPTVRAAAEKVKANGVKSAAGSDQTQNIQRIAQPRNYDRDEQRNRLSSIQAGRGEQEAQDENCSGQHYDLRINPVHPEPRAVRHRQGRDRL